MQTQKIIYLIEQNKTDILKSDLIWDNISLTQEDIKKILHITLTDDTKLFFTKKLWSMVEEDDIGLVKYDYYCHVLKQYHFSEKTARFICLKERDFKILNTGLLGKCGTIKSVDFLINAYNLGINNIIEGISSCVYEEQVPIMKHLLSRLNELQKNSALNKFMSAYLENYPKDIGLVKFVLKQKKNWDNNVLENESVKKVMLFNNIDEKLSSTKSKNKMNKI